MPRKAKNQPRLAPSAPVAKAVDLAEYIGEPVLVKRVQTEPAKGAAKQVRIFFHTYNLKTRTPSLELYSADVPSDKELGSAKMLLEPAFDGQRDSAAGIPCRIQASPLRLVLI